MPDARFTFSPVPGVHATRLANGLRLLVFENRSSPHVALRLVAPGGSVGDPMGSEGLASLTATLMRCGAGERSEEELSEALDFLAARLSVSTGREFCEVAGDVTTLRPGQLEEFLDIVADVVLRPTLSEEEVAKARTRRLGHLQQLADDHSGLCARAFELTAFSGHPFGRPSTGTLASVAGLDREQISGFHARSFSPDQAILALAGDLSPEEAERLVGERLGGWPRSEREPTWVGPGTPRPGVRVTLVDRQDPSLSQVHFRIGHPATITLADDDYLAFRLAAQVLGGDFTSRLNQTLRVREGLTYGARYTFSAGVRWAGSAAAVTYAPTKALGRAVKLTLEELERFSTEPTPAEEVLDFQRKLIHSFPFRFETPAATVDQYLWTTREGLPEGWLHDYQRALAAVTPEQVFEAARRHIRRDALDVVAVGNADLAPALAEVAGGEDNVHVTTLDHYGIR